jgi:hypothetical protein
MGKLIFVQASLEILNLRAARQGYFLAGADGRKMLKSLIWISQVFFNKTKNDEVF